MDLGFDTVGNATIIVYDKGPLLVTDPWLGGPAFFGSWRLSHAIPPPQLQAALDAPYVWFSHGHPDHLNGAWLDACRGRTVLLPDHVGGRIKTDLERGGLTTTVLKHATWTRLSDRVRVWCFADVNQDAVLLIAIGNAVVVNLNDANQTGWGPAVKREVSKFSRSFLLQLSGYGDATMINFTDEQGNRLPPLPKLRREAGYRVGDALSKTADGFGATYVVPFSSTHRYQRTDSAWANEFVVADEDYADGFSSTRAELLPLFTRYNCIADEVTALPQEIVDDCLLEPAEFGDDWSEELSSDDIGLLRSYVKRVERFDDTLGFVAFRVGGRDTVIGLRGRDRDRGVTFKAPRGSLMKAVTWEVFDDILAANFAETTLHGKWPAGGLGTYFGPYLTRYADNGRAHSRAEVETYLRAYRERLSGVDRVRNALEGGGARLVRTQLNVNGRAYRAARSLYWRAKRFAR